MKRLVRAVLLVASSAAGAFAAREGSSPFDVTACDIVIEVRPPAADAGSGEGTIRAQATLGFRRSSPLVRIVSFRLNGALTVTKVAAPDGAALPFVVRDKGALLQRIEIDDPSPTTDSTAPPADERILIAYEGPLRARVGDVTLALVEKERAFAFSAAGWYPLANVSDHFRATVTATAPKALVFVSNGTPALVAADDSTRTVRYSDEKPVAYLSFALGAYTVRRARHGDVDFSVSLYHDDGPLAERYLGEMEKIVDFYSERFGPYPFSGLALVEVDDRFALPRGTSALLLVTSSFLNDHFPDRFADELRVIAHEIAHQWWANLVAIDSPDDHWLNEGFAEYSALLYHEHRDGPERLHAYLRRVASTAVLPSGGDAVPLARGSELQNGPALLYAASKGAYVLHMLRIRLGDDKFFALLRAWAARFHFGRASTADFVALATEFGGAEALGGFFEQWLRSAAVPDLAVHLASTTAGEGGGRVRGSIDGMPPGFRAPVDLRFEAGLQSADVTIDCSAPRTPFEVTLRFAPERVCLDPLGKLLRRPQPKAIEDALIDADALFFFNRYEEAAARFRDALAIDPYEPRALFGLGRTWLALGESEIAESTLARVDADLLTGDRHIVAWTEIYRGIALDRLGRRDDAKVAYSAALRTGDNTNGARELAEEGLRHPIPERPVR
ncbi:MAG: hypothetical protein HYR85_16235 [Planctomycetes bacterium]|nr:hypothetical protein [Planctomycetota bacterium]MBI3845475.1 hypothetical protein [Planctomycetota bacterium]